MNKAIKVIVAFGAAIAHPKPQIDGQDNTGHLLPGEQKPFYMWHETNMIGPILLISSIICLCGSGVSLLHSVNSGNRAPGRITGIVIMLSVTGILTGAVLTGIEVGEAAARWAVKE